MKMVYMQIMHQKVFENALLEFWKTLQFGGCLVTEGPGKRAEMSVQSCI